MKTHVVGIETAEELGLFQLNLNVIRLVLGMPQDPPFHSYVASILASDEFLTDIKDGHLATSRSSQRVSAL